MAGSSAWRTITRWLATPTTTSRRPEAALAPEAADGGADGLGVLDLAVADRAGRQGHLAEARPASAVAAELELGGPDRERADVEADHARMPSGVASLQVGAHVVLGDPVAAAHPGATELAGLDQAVHGHVGDPQRAAQPPRR